MAGRAARAGAVWARGAAALWARGRQHLRAAGAVDRAAGAAGAAYAAGAAGKLRHGHPARGLRHARAVAARRAGARRAARAAATGTGAGAGRAVAARRGGDGGRGRRARGGARWRGRERRRLTRAGRAAPSSDAAPGADAAAGRRRGAGPAPFDEAAATKAAKKLKVVELRAALEAAGADTKGLKAALVERLVGVRRAAAAGGRILARRAAAAAAPAPAPVEAPAAAAPPPAPAPTALAQVLETDTPRNPPSLVDVLAPAPAAPTRQVTTSDDGDKELETAAQAWQNQRPSPYALLGLRAVEETLGRTGQGGLSESGGDVPPVLGPGRR